MTINPTEYWANPEAYSGQVSKQYIRYSLPVYYESFWEYSLRILAVIDRHFGSDWSMLELGCSIGRNLRQLQDFYYIHLTGVEVNPEAVAMAREYLGKEVKIIHSSIEDYLPTAPQYDIIFTQSVLMHIPPKNEHVFALMAKKARKLIVTHEVEETGGLGAELKWSRNYKDVFEGLGMKQLEFEEFESGQTLRVFKK